MANEEIALDQPFTANQLFKKYKVEGGTLNFSNWLTREKTKGIFPLNSTLNEDINLTLNGLKPKKKMESSVLGFPTKTLVILGVVIIGAVIVSQVFKKKV